MNWQELRSISFLSKLTDAELEALSGVFSARTASNGERIVTEGTPITSFSIVLHGTVNVRRLAKKREVLLARICRGGFFGEIHLFEPGNATASIDAVGEITLAEVSSTGLQAFMESHPVTGYKIVSALLVELSQRLKTTNDRFANAFYWAREAKPE
ncbi:MAG: cyclic nucleotide-binding domain-containing protein [Verrucomicrobiota bacterium]